MVGNKILVKKKDPPVCPEFWYGWKKNLVKKKDPPVCPEFWCGREQNSGEKKTPSVVTVGQPRFVFFYLTLFRGYSRNP